ncbi:MAG TPA: LPS export ABC transporter periplasmic protein LptC [Gemmatimonadales bacterium]
MSPSSLLAFLAFLALLACSEQGVAPTTSAVAADSADQIIEGMTTTIVADGVRRSLVSADTAFIYQGRQVADMRQIRASFFDVQGNQTSVLTAESGLYQITLGTLEARGNVVVVATDGSNRRLTTEHLIYDRATNQIRSDSAFVYQSPDGVLRGNSFYADPDFRNVVTKQPRGRQRGTGVLLPGQRPPAD